MDSACWLLDDDKEGGKENKEAVNRAVIIVLACSDAMLRLLFWQDNKLSVRDEAVAGEHCLLQVVKIYFCYPSIFLWFPIPSIFPPMDKFDPTISETGGKVRGHRQSCIWKHLGRPDGLGSN